MKTPAKTVLAALFGALMLCPPLPIGGAAQAADAPAATASQAKPSWYPKRVDLAFVKARAVTIVDSRPAARKFDVGHIPNAVNIPDSQFDKLAPSMLPTDKTQLLIFYCDGPECILSHNSAFKAEKLGYTNVHVFAEGYPAWEKAYGPGPGAAVAATAPVQGAPVMVAGKESGSITVESFERIYRDAPGTVHLIDVRTPAEFASGTFKGATNVPIDTLEKNLAKLPTDKPIVFFCGAGGRSGEAHDMVKMYRPELKIAYLDAKIQWTQAGVHTFGGK